MASDGSKTITLKSSDGKTFEADMAVASYLQVVKLALEDCEEETNFNKVVIPLFEVDTKNLTLIIEYYKKFVELKEKQEQGFEEFKKKFFQQIEKKEGLKGLFLAANYLNASELIEAVTEAIAKHIQNKSVEYVRKYFGIVNDFTPEEEAQLREEYRWAFDGVDDD